MRRTMSSLLLVTLAGPALRGVAHAHDQVSSAADADRDVQRGVELREQGKDEEALHLFTHAYEATRAPRPLAQIALAEQALGRWLDAEVHLLTALEAVQRDAWIRKNKAYLGQALTAIQSRLASLEVLGGKPGAEVRIEGRLVGTLPLAGAVRIVAGSVPLEVTLPGHYPVRRTLSVPPGAIGRETIALLPDEGTAPRAATASLPAQNERVAAPEAGPVAVASPDRVPDQTATTSATVANPKAYQKPVAIGLLAAGGASLIIGVIFHVARERAANDFNGSRCDPDNPMGPVCPGLKDDVDGATVGAVIGYVGAAVLGAAGGYLLWSAPRTADGTGNGQALVAGWRGQF